MNPELKRNSEYWAERFKILEQSTFEHSEEWTKSAERQFRKALKTIKDRIAWLYIQFEETTGMNLADAKKAMDKKTLEEFQMTVEEYIKLGESLNEHFDRDVLKKLIIASDRVRISRYEAIRYYIEAEIAKLYAEFDAEAYDRLGEAYENRYYQTAYEMRGLGYSFAKLNKDQIQQALKQPWRDVQFSETIWGNQSRLKKNLTDVITQAIITGQGYTETSRKLEAKMKAGSNNCARIISTEMAAISSKAQQKMFNELNVKKYEIVATLDTRTSQICQKMDGKVFEYKDYQVGETAPPFHPHCRTTTSPYFDDMRPSQRAARNNEGKTEYVDNQSYYEWAKANDIKPVYGLWEPPDKRKKILDYNFRKASTEKDKKSKISKQGSPKDSSKKNSQNLSKVLTTKDSSKSVSKGWFEEDNSDKMNYILPKLLSSETLKDKLNKEKQEKHFRNSKRYETGRSYFENDFDEFAQILEEIVGTGDVVTDNNGNPTNKERLKDNRIKGVFVDKETGKEQRTDRIIVCHSKTGYHAFPANPKWG